MTSVSDFNRTACIVRMRLGDGVRHRPRRAAQNKNLACKWCGWPLQLVGPNDRTDWARYVIQEEPW